jgi:hypothetical protein
VQSISKTLTRASNTHTQCTCLADPGSGVLLLLLTSDSSCDRSSPALAILLSWLNLRQQHAWQAGQRVCVHTGCQHMGHLQWQQQVIMCASSADSIELLMI